MLLDHYLSSEISQNFYLLFYEQNSAKKIRGKEKHRAWRFGRSKGFLRFKNCAKCVSCYSFWNQKQQNVALNKKRSDNRAI